jgi:serine/threonine protein kinase
MGVVYRARDPATGVEAALKVMLGDASDDARALERFQREIAAARSVTHGNVVCVLDAGSTPDGSPFVAFELVEGGSLSGRLKETGPIPPAEVVTIGVGIARALAAMQAAGIVHRDLKPANILIGSEGEPKVADFGLARRSDVAALTRTGEVLGTLEFMAPEQLDRAREVDGRADLYALGATLWALLVGRPPFEGQGVELMKKHLVEKPRPPSELAIEVPPELDELIIQLLAKEPKDRPQSADEVAARLGRIGAAPARARRGPGAIVATVFAVGIVAGGGGAWWVVAGRSTSTQPPTPSSPPPPTGHAPAVARTNAPPKRDPHLKRASSIEPLDAMAVDVACSPTEPTKIATASLDGVAMWDVGSGTKNVWHSQGIHAAQCIAFSKDGARLAVGTKGLNGEASVQILDAANSRSLVQLVGHGVDVNMPLTFADDPDRPKETVTSVRFLSGGRIASGGHDGTLRVWSERDRKELFKLHDGDSDHAHEGDVMAIAESDPGTIITSGYGGKVLRWRLESPGKPEETWSIVGSSPVGSSATSIALASGDVLLGLRSGGLIAWLKDGERRTILPDVTSTVERDVRINGAAFLDDEARWAVTSSWDRTVRLWDIADRKKPARDPPMVLKSDSHALAVDCRFRFVYVATDDSVLERFEVDR